MASCILKGSPGPIPGCPDEAPTVDAMSPNELPTRALGCAILTRLKILNISARNCTLNRSLIGMFLKTERSIVASPGPYTEFFCMVPNVPTGGFTNAEGVNQRSD